MFDKPALLLRLPFIDVYGLAAKWDKVSSSTTVAVCVFTDGTTPIQTRRPFYLLVSFDVGRVDADVSWRRRNDGVKLDDVIDEELHSMFEIFVTDAEAK